MNERNSKTGRGGWLAARGIYLAGNLLLRGSRRILYGPFDPKSERILVFRTGNLGDSFCALPVFLALRKRFPRARLTLLTAEAEPGLPDCAEIFREFAPADALLRFPSRARRKGSLRALGRRLRGERFDLVVYLGQSAAPWRRILRDLVFFRWAGVRAAAGFAWNRHFFFRKAQTSWARFPDETARLAGNLKGIGIDPAALPFPLPPPLPEKRLPPGPGRTVAVHPTAKYPAKLWPEDRFIEVAAGLARRYPDVRFLVVGDSGAGPVGRRLAKVLPGRAFDLSGRLTLSELAGILARVDLLVSLDSGPVHVAAAFGTPVVGIYSSRDYPRSWHPRGNGHAIIRTDPPCAACRKTVCGSLECTRAIAAETVIEAAGRILEARCP